MNMNMFLQHLNTYCETLMRNPLHIIEAQAIILTMVAKHLKIRIVNIWFENVNSYLFYAYLCTVFVFHAKAFET